MLCSVHPVPKKQPFLSPAIPHWPTKTTPITSNNHCQTHDIMYQIHRLNTYVQDINLSGGRGEEFLSPTTAEDWNQTLCHVFLCFMTIGIGVIKIFPPWEMQINVFKRRGLTEVLIDSKSMIYVYQNNVLLVSKAKCRIQWNQSKPIRECKQVCYV